MQEILCLQEIEHPQTSMDMVYTCTFLDYP